MLNDTNSTDRRTAEQAVHNVLEDRVRAIHSGDAAAVVAPNADDVLTFDVLPPLRNSGAAGVRKRTDNWFAGYDGVPGYEIQDLEVHAGPEYAFAIYLYHVSGTLKTGDQVNMWVRCTVCLRREGEEWRIVHQHDSVPFDPKSGKAILDQEP